MEGIVFKEIAGMNNYGYRIVLKDERVCIVYERRETESEREVLRIYPFNEKCKLKIYFVKEKKLIEVNWAQIQPKQNEKGFNLFYEEERLVNTKEFFY